MYRAETWSLNTSLLLKLESFQAEIGKRVLKLPRFTANNVPLMALGWPSMRCRCLCAKLFLLHTVSSRNIDTLSSEVYKTLSTLDVESISLVKQCHFLELPYTTNFTNEILCNSVDSIRNESSRLITPFYWNSPKTINLKN